MTMAGCTHTHRTAMAERTGDPTLDGLIDMFMSFEVPPAWEGYWDEIEDATYPGKEEGHWPTVEMMRDPSLSEGNCVTVASDFVDWLENTDSRYKAWLPESPYPEEFGYTDRPRSGSPCHAWANVQTPDGSIFGIDFTASQYGYIEHPMVQRLEGEGGEGWQREWTVSSIDTRYASQPVLHANRGEDLVGLPKKPVRVGPHGELEFGSHGHIQQVAENYMQEAGLPYRKPRHYLPVESDRAAAIANEYDAMPHAPNDPNVKASYDALKAETRAQYEHALKHGYQFEFYPEGQDPYPHSPREAVLDLHKNRHMFVYPTEEGYGNEQDEWQEESMQHPMLEDSGYKWGEKPVTYNDLFRAVHDFYGHAKEGVGFRADGEENAWRQHAAMFSPQALPAMTAETRGQNSWVNFGPYGEQNRAADQASTVYAPQKAGIMPEWVHTEGAGDPDEQWRTASEDMHLFDERGQMEDFFTRATGGEFSPGQELLPEHGPQHLEHQQFYQDYRDHSGEFSKHIDTSIPQYAANMANKGQSIINAMPGSKVLDIAGGEGSFVKALAAQGMEAHNLEPNTGMHRHFDKTQVPGAGLIPMAFGTKGFEDNEGNWVAPHAPQSEYDVVHEAMGLQFIGPEREEQIEHAKKYLRPGGLLIVDEKVKPGPTPYDQAMWNYHEGVKDQWKRNYFTPEEMATKNVQVGFQPQGHRWARRKISRLGGFQVWSADIHQLAEQMRTKLLTRPDVQEWGQQEAGRGINDVPVQWYNDVPVRWYEYLHAALEDMPDEGFKLMPWVVREFKRGGVPLNRFQHAKDIFRDASRWFAWAREHNKSVPDYMKKDFDLSQMQAWVYEMNAQNIEGEGWTDSTPVYTWPDGWHMDRVGEQDLALEGELMGHCVGGYCNVVRSGATTIYSLRDPKGQPHVTIEVSDDQDLTKGYGESDRGTRHIQVVQVQGKQDTVPIPEYRGKVDEWFEHVNSLGWEINEQEAEHDPEYEYEEHYAGPRTLETPEDVLEYHETMHDSWEAGDQFGEDEEGTWEGNVITYQNPRALAWTDDDLIQVGQQTINAILRTPAEYDQQALTQIAQGMWMAVQHQAASQFHYDPNERLPQDRWHGIVTRLRSYYDQVIQPKEKRNDPSLFDPNVYNQAQRDPNAEAFLDFLARFQDAPEQWEETFPPMKAPTWHVRQHPGQPYVEKQRLHFPGDGNYGKTHWPDYFAQHGLDALKVPGVFAKLGGMLDMLVSKDELERLLQKHFRFVTQYWSAGNFKGYLASDSQETIQSFLQHYKHHEHGHEAEPVPRHLPEQQGYVASVRKRGNIADLIATTLTNGGGTFQQDLSPATHTFGYLVSRKGYGAEIPVREFGPKEVGEWLKDVPFQARDLIGTWIDDAGTVYLDVTEWIEDLNEAIQFALQNNQQAIYDAGTDTVIETKSFAQ